MSVASHHEGFGRPLRKDEADLISAMVRGTQKANDIIPQIPYLMVRDMNDGGMGSLRFLEKDTSLSQHFGICLCEAEFLDLDGVMVSAALNLDKDGRIFELDLWKVDFSPLQHIPNVSAVKLKPWLSS